MLFPYTYVTHSMEKMQDYLDFIFFEVWCQARDDLDYDIEMLFVGNDDLRIMISELYTSELQGANFFLTGLQQIFEDFKQLSDRQIDQLKNMCRANNDIESACSGRDDVVPVTYADINLISEDLSNHLQAFYKNLYSQSFLSLQSIQSRIGEIDSHYRDFMTTNIQGKCPFCGIHDIKGIYHTKREAYDHFLPKGQYPFNTINFHNLVPACHECNSSYKLVADPLSHSKNPLASQKGMRRKALYPFTTAQYTIELAITLNVNDWTALTPDEIEIDAGHAAMGEEIDTWLDIYDIEERYKAKCCSESDGKGWIREVVDESQNYGQTPLQFLNGKLKTADNQPWVDANFLKKPFLEACRNQGVFGSLPNNKRKQYQNTQPGS
ncbi:MAG: hypothetical protein V3U84_08125 [Thiotrichaceae bacterium]